MTWVGTSYLGLCTMLIMDVHNQYNLPIFVTEHGIAENKSKDTLRVNILSYAFACIKKAEE